MWTRFHIKCNSCDKVTNLRIQIPEKSTLPVTFNCLGCSSELRAILLVNFEKGSWDFKAERGTLVEGDFAGGDYFYEFSDTIATGKPSNKPHETLMPTLRMPAGSLVKLKEAKDMRKIHSQEDWENLKDLARAYVRFDKPVIEKIVKKILGNIFPPTFFVYKIDLDYHYRYFVSLNYLVSPWIDFESHAKFVEWLDDNVFTQNNINNLDLLDYVQNVMAVDVCDRIKQDVSELIIRFADLREYFFYANHSHSITDGHASIQDFVQLKNFYTDCFEFLGRNSHLVFRLQNFFERGSQNLVPMNAPKNVTTAAIFAAIDHGQKLDILNMSNEPELKLVFSNSFDSKLRNGINHFKAKFNNETQIIYYYPITKKPDERHEIKYIDFLNMSLDSFNSVLKIGQLVKIVTVYRFSINHQNQIAINNK